MAEARYCPGCRSRHLAGTLGSNWLWFTCQQVRYSFPDFFSRVILSSELLARQVGCPSCGREADATLPENEIVHYVCPEDGWGIYAESPCVTVHRASEWKTRTRRRSPSRIKRLRMLRKRRNMFASIVVVAVLVMVATVAWEKLL